MPVYRVDNFAPLVIDLSIPINGVAFRQVEIKLAVEVTTYAFGRHLLNNLQKSIYLGLHVPYKNNYLVCHLDRDVEVSTNYLNNVRHALASLVLLMQPVEQCSK